jgi:hypothetical protein
MLDRIYTKNLYGLMPNQIKENYLGKIGNLQHTGQFDNLNEIRKSNCKF